MSLVVNKRVNFDYEILETVEAGLQLFGFEVKSVRAGHMQISASYAIIRGGEAYLINAQISSYQPNNELINYDKERTRKLLLTRKEINYLDGKVKERGLTIVPLKVYNKDGFIKISLGLAKHKKKVDKRSTIKERETKRYINRFLKNQS
ncbi:MAG: SsrA-binding protein [Candidatus Liptonbacteria bacterium CG11_big_fil_rev_8_21_14_0_20_35_14]|uniref:SsrA-binding protein n=1 Tax=Candidatus Liptonbacteria bacterium CG11_big_fil_rev_8_21_14_0_20_35_14 TaxID=1974634 RepID=A0A2H0N7Z5_9BACT|nr:MAG: SsrA-binding protein [Candidatus Liptonbacteria bacterium CG11_big_fil_rev_8_21_14_0_20_35_14]